MAIIKSPVKTLSAYMSRSRTRNKSPETTVSGVPLDDAGLQGPRTRNAGGTQPRLVRHSSLPSLYPSEQLQQQAAQEGERELWPQSLQTTRSPFAEPSHGVELLQPRLLGLHHQPEHQETVQQDPNRRAYSESEILGWDSNSERTSQVVEIMRGRLGAQNLKDTKSAPSRHDVPLLRQAQSDILEAARLYQVASQNLKQAKEREEAIMFEQEMHMLKNYGDSDNSSSSSYGRHSGSEEGHLNLELSAVRRQSASMPPPHHRVENERRTKQHESPVFSKRTRQLLLTPRAETPPVDATSTLLDTDALEASHGNANMQGRERPFDGESPLLAWLESRRNIGKAGALPHHPLPPGIKVKSEEREASYSAALKEERDSGDRLQYQEYDVLIEIPSSVGSESGFGSNASPQKRWRRSPTPLPPRSGLHHSQSSPKPTPPLATAGTSRDTRPGSRSLPPRPRPSRSHAPRPRPYTPPPNPPQATMHSQRSTQTSPQGPQLFSKSFSDRLGSYPAVVFYTHIDHVENYYQQPHEHHIRSHGDANIKEPPSLESDQAMEQDDDEALPRAESPEM